MSIDVSGFTQAVTDGSTAAVAVAIAWGVAIWSVRAMKLLRGDDGFTGDQFDTEMDECPACHTESSWNHWDACHGVCPECGFVSPSDDDGILLDGTQPLSDVTGDSVFYSCDHCGVNSVDDSWIFEGEDHEECPQCGGELIAEDVT